MPPSSACAAHWVIPQKILASSKLSRVAATAFSYPSMEWRRNALRFPADAVIGALPWPLPFSFLSGSSPAGKPAITPPLRSDSRNGQSGERSRYERVNLARRQVSGFRGSHRILSPRRGHGRNPSRPNPWSDEDISRGEGSQPLCRQLVSRRQSRPGNARGITRGETQPAERFVLRLLTTQTPC